MNREALIEKVKAAMLAASWPDGGHDGFPGSVVAKMLAPAVLDVILPQVSTVEELEALPNGTVLVSVQGFPYWLTAADGSRAALADIDYAPFTVVWRPES